MRAEAEHPVTIVIADDERIVREGIRDRIDWESLGYRLLGDHEDGREALAAVRANPPDLLLTDIRMPFIDGIELTRTVTEEFPLTQVLLLTGHDEFEYAQSAVRLQVRDFLLKPISARELSEVLDRVGGEIRVARAQRRAARAVEARWNEARPILAERAFNELLYGQRAIEPSLERLDRLGVPLAAGRCRVVLVAPDLEPPSSGDRLASEVGPANRPLPEPGTTDVVSLSLGTLVEAAFSGYGQMRTTTTRGDRLALILTGPDDDLRDRLERVRDLAPHDAGTTVTVAVGRAFGRLSDLRRSVADAERALARRFLSGGNRVIWTDEPTAAEPRVDVDRSELRAELIIRIRNVDRDGSRDAVGRLVDHTRATCSTVPEAILAFQRDAARLLDVADELDADVSDGLGGDGNPFEAIARLPSLDAIGDWLSEVVAGLVDSLERAIGDHAAARVRTAMRVIEERYDDPGLSLTEVCDLLSVSVSHFSASFKREVGRTFVEHLTEVRIGRARELLAHEAVRGYEVARRVGYRDPHYFSTAFKKVTGMTPTEYRRSVADAEPAR